MKEKQIKSSSAEFPSPASSQQDPKTKPSYLPVAILVSIAFGFYFNTVFNGYALDDELVITLNKFTMKGLAGIPAILSQGAFAGLEGTWGNDLSGGRYRPLSMVTFAVEQGLFGTNLPVSHLINVLIYCLIVLFLFRLLHEHFFKEKPGLAFLTTLLFAIHPVHTEVVANLKSRDELLALLFLILSVELFFRHALVLSLIAFFLALLSKESAITFLAVIPLTSYVFLRTDWKVSAGRTVPYIAVTAGYFLLRYEIVGLAVTRSVELMNAPFLLATGVEAFCTKVVVLGKYLLLLFFPHPLAYDYSYRQIPYAHLSELRFLLALLVNAGLAALALILIKRRNIYAYGILIYFISISIVSNFVFDIGATMGERFLFQPSLGFAIAIGYGAYQFISFRKSLTAALVLLVVFAGYKTISRNRDWKDNLTLFSKDIETVPNSAMAHNSLAAALLNNSANAKDEEKKQMLDKAISQAKIAAAIYPSYLDAHLNLGLAYARLGNLASATDAWETAKALEPESRILKINLLYLSDLYLKEGVKAVDQDRNKAKEDLEKAIRYNPSNAQALFNLGGVFYLMGDLPTARDYWRKTLIVDPSHKNAADWLKRTGD